MAWGRKKRDTAALSSVTAAAQRVELTDDQAHQLAFKKAEDWQRRAWEFYDSVGEAGYAANFMGNSIGRLRAFVATRPDPQGDPKPVEDEPVAEDGYSAQEAATAQDALDRLKSPAGNRNELQRRLGVNAFVAGDCFLIGEQPEGRDESWDVYSAEQVRIDRESQTQTTTADGRTITIPKITLVAPGGGGAAGGQGRELPPEATAYRVWTPHPRYWQWADSPFRRSLTILEELDTATRSILGALRSRLNGPGAMFLPMRMAQAGQVKSPDLDQNGQPLRSSGFVKDLVETTSRAIQDPATAAARLPYFAFVPDDLWEKIDATKHLVTWDRSFDEQMSAVRGELVQRFATAVDLPPEVLTGKGDVNHWQAWNIDEDTYRAHVQPFAARIFEALTIAYLHPTLVTMGIQDVERFVLWFDPTDLVADPDRQKRAMELHAAYLLSNEVARREAGYTEDDMPEDDEIAKRVWIDAAKSGRAPIGGPVPDSENEGPPAIEPAPSDEQDEQPIPERAAAAAEPVAAIVASAKDRALAQLGRRLLALDVGLLMETHSRADVTMRRALERANARLKTLAMRAGNGDRLKRAVQGLPPDSLQVAPTLGEQLVLQLADEDTAAGMFAGAFGSYLTWWDQRTGRTQDEATQAILVAGDMPDDQLPEHVAALDADRTAARALLDGALVVLAGSLLFRPDVPAGPSGEVAGELVKPGVLRSAAIRAGGGGEHATGLTSGDRFHAMLGDSLIEISGWVWDYGDPGSRFRPFTPHVDMDGMFFANWDNDELGNADASFPGYSHYFPGDHTDCQCQAREEYRRVPKKKQPQYTGTESPRARTP